MYPPAQATETIHRVSRRMRQGQSRRKVAHEFLHQSQQVLTRWGLAVAVAAARDGAGGTGREAVGEDVVSVSDECERAGEEGRVRSMTHDALVTRLGVRMCCNARVACGEAVRSVCRLIRQTKKGNAPPPNSSLASHALKRRCSSPSSSWYSTPAPRLAEEEGPSNLERFDGGGGDAAL